MDEPGWSRVSHARFELMEVGYADLFARFRRYRIHPHRGNRPRRPNDLLKPSAVGTRLSRLRSRSAQASPFASVVDGRVATHGRSGAYQACGITTQDRATQEPKSRQHRSRTDCRSSKSIHPGLGEILLSIPRAIRKNSDVLAPHHRPKRGGVCHPQCCQVGKRDHSQHRIGIKHR